MNNLKKLRVEIGLSQSQLSEYVDIPRSNLSNLETGDRPFRQVHLEKLTSFFGVTTDYLLGKNEYGIEVYPEWGNDSIYLTKEEYDLLKSNISITVQENKVGKLVGILYEQSGEKTVISYKYFVYRELKGNFSDYGISSVKREIQNKIDKLDEDDLEKLLRFIKDFL